MLYMLSDYTCTLKKIKIIQMKEFHTSRIILSQASLTLMSVTKSISVRIGFVEMSDI